jgi:hypothetical protein
MTFAPAAAGKNLKNAMGRNQLRINKEGLWYAIMTT